jgi:hypothetical protein
MKATLPYTQSIAFGENSLVAWILFPGALLWWGWTADKHEFWAFDGNWTNED